MEFKRGDWVYLKTDADRYRDEGWFDRPMEVLIAHSGSLVLRLYEDHPRYRPIGCESGIYDAKYFYLDNKKTKPDLSAMNDAAEEYEEAMLAERLMGE